MEWINYFAWPLLVAGIVFLFFKRGSEIMIWCVGMAGCLLIFKELWPAWYSFMSILAIPPMAYRVYRIFQKNRRETLRKKADLALQAEFLTWYSNWVAEKGKLFERAQVPVTQLELQQLKKWALIYGAIIFAATLLFAVPMHIFLWDDPRIHNVTYGIFVVGSAISLLVWFYFSRTKNRLKTVIRGVITRKSFDIADDEESYQIFISEEEWLEVTRTEYFNFDFGDIIEAEWIGDIVKEERKIKGIGSVHFKSSQK